VQARRHDLIGAKLLARPVSGVGGASMLQNLRGIALIAALLLNCGAAVGQQDVFSANAVMPGCRTFLGDMARAKTSEALDAARCLGLVEGIAYGAAAGTFVCYEPTVTSGQTIRVVMKYIDSRPERLHQDFRALALEALLAAWPCQK
jgi:Rap1a immunity proteins